MAKHRKKGDAITANVESEPEGEHTSDHPNPHRPEPGIDALKNAGSSFVDDWNPRTGEIYLGSQYFESLDGFTPSLLAGSADDHQSALKEMATAVKRVEKNGELESLFGPNGDADARKRAAELFLGDG